MQKVQMLQQCGVQPIIVFDGGRLPMKAAEEGSRSRLLAAKTLVYVWPVVFNQLLQAHVLKHTGCKVYQPNSM